MNNNHYVNAINSTRDRYIEAFSSGDEESLGNLFVTDAIRKSPGFDDCVGRDEIKAQYRNWTSTFGKSVIGDQYRFVKGHTMICVWSWQGIHEGNFMDVPPQGKAVGLVGSSIIDFDEQGNIVREHTYLDPYTIMIQLGVIQDNGRDVPTIPDSYQLIYGESEYDAINKKHLRKYNQLLTQQKMEPWLDYMTDDVEWDDQMVPGLAIGKDHSADDFKMLCVAFPDSKINMTNMWSVGNYVIHQGVFTATHKGPLKGIPASDRVVNIDNMDIVYFEGDRISKGWTFGNTLDLGSQLGMGQ